MPALARAPASQSPSDLDQLQVPGLPSRARARPGCSSAATATPSSSSAATSTWGHSNLVPMGWTCGSRWDPRTITGKWRSACSAWKAESCGGARGGPDRTGVRRRSLGGRSALSLVRVPSVAAAPAPFASGWPASKRNDAPGRPDRRAFVFLHRVRNGQS